MSRFIALIPAAGVGERFGAGKPKQYVEIAGKTVLQHTLEIFLHHAEIDNVVVVLSPHDALFPTLLHDKLTVLRCGGFTNATTLSTDSQGTSAGSTWMYLIFIVLARKDSSARFTN